MLPKLAYSIEEFTDVTGLGRTAVFDAIKTGRLRAKKSGRRTLILKEHADQFLRSLPDVSPNTAPDSEPTPDES
jgi:excisionase family DNA binding protein